ncbi:NlpC/P60 family protein [Streptomyces sp. NPDC001381]|uniref:NlpC/P60 family protein n=1 Tax=Streptomyces sp. NPDC001381 TaxID=3364567 RepID=UPI0036D10429
MAMEVGEPSRAEVQQAVHALYDRAESDTGNFNATRAAMSGANRRSGVSLARGGRGSADPSTEAMARKWFDVARSSIGPTVEAVLPADRMPARPVAAAGPRVPMELERAFENAAGRTAEPGRRLELEAPERRTPELTARAVPALPAAPERAPAALEPRREELAPAIPSQPTGLPMGPQPGTVSQPLAAQPMRPPTAPVSQPGDTAEQQVYRAEAAAAWAGQAPAAGSDAAAQRGGSGIGGDDQLPEAKIMTPGAGAGSPSGGGRSASRRARSASGGAESTPVFPTSEFGVAKPAFSFPMPEIDPATGSFILPDFDAVATTPASGTPAARPGPSTGSFTFPMPDAEPTTPATGTPAAQPGPGTGSFTFPMPDAAVASQAGATAPGAVAASGGAGAPSAEFGGAPPFSFPYPEAGPGTPAAGTPMPQTGPASGSFSFPMPDASLTTPPAGTPMAQTGLAMAPAGPPMPDAALTASAAGFPASELVGAAPQPGFPAPELVGAAPQPGFPASGAGVAAPMQGMAASPAAGLVGAPMGYAEPALTAPAPVAAPAPAPMPAPAPAPAPMPAPAAAYAPAPASAAAPVGATFSATGAAYLGKADKALAFARAQVGRPCVWGATGPESYDCSSLTQAAWRAAGVTLPRSAIDQAKAFTRVGLDELRPGDLVFFHDDLSHVGLCTDGGTMIHAPGPGAHIREEPILAVGEGTVRGAVRPA